METREGFFYCATCGRALPIPQGYLGTGYAVDGRGRKSCYACCADQDRQHMADNGRITLYLTMNAPAHGQHSFCAARVTNWPGSLSFPARGTHGTIWRRAVPWRDGSGRLRFKPRVPWGDVAEMLEREDRP